MWQGEETMTNQFWKDEQTPKWFSMWHFVKYLFGVCDFFLRSLWSLTFEKQWALHCKVGNDGMPLLVFPNQDSGKHFLHGSKKLLELEAPFCDVITLTILSHFRYCRFSHPPMQAYRMLVVSVGLFWFPFVSFSYNEIVLLSLTGATPAKMSTYEERQVISNTKWSIS